MNYYIADLHLGHKNVLRFDERPFKTLEAMHKAIIENWNSVVNASDSVYILGDLTWNNAIGVEVVSQLKGRKFLILGNHDKLNQELKEMFEYVKDYDSITDNNEQIILSHYPLLCWRRSDYGSVHLYGHVHSGRDYELVLDNRMRFLEEGRKHECYNVGCMLPYMNYTPRTLAEIRDSCSV